MTSASFIHLRSHSSYSLLEGAVTTKNLVTFAQKQGMPAIAQIDTGNLFGALEFSLAAAQAGIQPITGCKLQVLRDVKTKKKGFVGSQKIENKQERDALILIAKDEPGYRNLLKLVSLSFVEHGAEGTPFVTAAELTKYNEGIIALSAGIEGQVGKFLLDDKAEEAEKALLTLNEIYKGHFYIELMRHGRPQENRIEAALIDLAYKHEIPLVATNECLFLDESMFDAHAALLCVADGVTMEDSNRRVLTPEYRFKTAAEMVQLFEDIPEAIQNTVQIAKRCSFMPKMVNPILPPFTAPSGLDEVAELKRQAEEGLKSRLSQLSWLPKEGTPERLEAEKPYWERLEFEVGVISSMGFSGYFLIVADFIKYANSQDIPVGPGRGSGAGSLVAWALTITGLDPIYFGLLFERFLNPDRVSMPDFDIDFCQDRRDEVIDYVRNKYGKERVAQIITFGKLQARAVLRDVGRALSMPYGQVDRLCKLVPNNPAAPVTLAEAIISEPQLRQMGREDEMVDRLLTMGKKLEGLYRHASTHAAGVVIGDRPLNELIPLYYDPRSDLLVTQFNMKYVEQAGLVKFDFLGLKTLTVMQKAIKYIVQGGGENIDLATIPLDHKETFEMLCRCESVGVFQVESAGMRDVMRKMQPHRFEELIALVALFRPGPMENIPKYLACKHGEEEIDCLHPLLETILTETYGIMIYQEQVMQVAQKLAGYSLSEADLLRRAMGKKIQAEMDAQGKLFVDRAQDLGIDRETAENIFEQMAKFAGYGFNKSHAAAYAMVLYQTAYLKARYPVEFLAASMTYDMGNTDKLGIFKSELERMGIQLLPPCIQASGPEFHVEVTPEGKKAVRYSFAALKGVGQQAAELLADERKAKGAFKSLDDFVARLDSRVVNKRLLESLICAGAFDTLHENRAELFASVEILVRQAGAHAQEKASNQVNLFGGPSDSDTHEAMQLNVTKPWKLSEKLTRECDAIGFYLTSHPLNAYEETLEKLGVRPSTALQAQAGRYRAAGVVLSYRVRKSAKGNAYAFVQLSDVLGTYEVIWFAEALTTGREWLDDTKPLLMDIEVKIDDGQVRMAVHKVQLLDDVQEPGRMGRDLSLRVANLESVAELKDLLEEAGPGSVKVKTIVDTDQHTVELALPKTYRIKTSFYAAIADVHGLEVA